MKKYNINENTWVAQEYLKKILFQDYETGYVAIYTALHVGLDGFIQYGDSEVIANSILAPVKSIDDAKATLEEMGFIYPIDGKYKVNPYYIYKGYWEELCSKLHKASCKAWDELVGTTKPHKLCNKRKFINVHLSVEYLIQSFRR